ncbi:hypothetical protein [Xanthomonas phage RTH11]|nr:hypothetical protein [Xanthomonas phage RTH11]
MILFSCNNPNNIDAHVLCQDDRTTPVQLTRLARAVELEKVVFTHEWQFSPTDFRREGISGVRHVGQVAKDFQSLYSLYRDRVGNTGLTFEQWLSVLPGIGSGQAPVDYIGLYMCQDGKQWIVSVTKAKLHLTEITESILIKNYVVMPLRDVIAGARQRTEKRLALIESFGQRLNDGEYLGDITWRGDQEIDMESFITDYLLKD